MTERNPARVERKLHEMKRLCEICSKSVAASYYIQHLKNHDKMYTCPICPEMQFRFKKEFHRHCRAHKIPMIYRDLEKVGDFEVKCALGRKALVYTATLDDDTHQEEYKMEHDGDARPIINTHFFNQMKEIISTALERLGGIRCIITFNVLYNLDTDLESDAVSVPPVSGELSSKIFILRGEMDVENALLDAINFASNLTSNIVSNSVSKSASCLAKSQVNGSRWLMRHVKDVELKIYKYVPNSRRFSPASMMSS